MPDSASARVPRLPLSEAKAAADEAGRLHGRIVHVQVLLNHPTLARAINDLLATMLWHGRLAPRLRELVIMLPPSAQGVWRLAQPAAARWHDDLDLALGGYVRDLPRQRLAVPEPVSTPAEIAVSDPVSDDRCGEHTAMMPTRRRSRAQNRARRIEAECRQNREAREAHHKQWVSTYFGPAPPGGEDDEPPPF